MSKKILQITGDFGEDHDVMVSFQVLHSVGYTVHAVCPNKKSGEYITCVVQELEEYPKYQTYTEKIGHKFYLNYDFEQVNPEDYFLSGVRAPECLKYNPNVLKLVKYFTDNKKSILVICHGYQILCAIQGSIENLVLCGPNSTSYEISNAGGIYQQVTFEEALLYNNFISTSVYTGFLKCFPPFIDQLKNGIQFDNKVNLFK